MSINKFQLALLRYQLNKLSGWVELIEAVRKVEPRPEPEQVPDRVKATRDWGVGGSD